MLNFLAQYQKVQWLIFTIACLIYINTIPNNWVLDDTMIVHQNTYVKRGSSGIIPIFTTDAFSGFFGKDINSVSGGRYRPMSIALFALQANLFASDLKDVNGVVQKDKEGYTIKDLSEQTTFPNILHFFNVIFYGLLCLILYRTLLRLFNNYKESSLFFRNFMAFATSLLYTVHPIHTEVVANVKGLDEILAMMGAVTTLYCILKYLDINDGNAANPIKPQRWLIASAITYTIALFSKETAITFIAIIPLSLWFFRKVEFKKLFTFSIILLLPLLFFLSVRSMVLKQSAKNEIAEELMNDPFLVLDPKAEFAPLVPGSNIKKLVNPNANSFTKMPYSNQLATNLYTYNKYLKLLVLPYPLTVDYYPRHIAVKSFGDISVLFALLVQVLILGWALFHIRKRNLIAFGILFYYITFSIVSNLFFPIGTNMAERFMFMPSLGFCLVMSYSIFALAQKWNERAQSEKSPIIYLIFIAILLSYSGLSINRNFDWKDNFTLFSKDILISKNSGKITSDLAGEFIKKAMALNNISDKELTINKSQTDNIAISNEIEVEKVKLLQKAIPLLNKSLEIHPMSGIAWFQVSNVYLFLGMSPINSPNVNLTYLNTAKEACDLAEFYKSESADTLIKSYKALCLMEIAKVMGQQFGDFNTAISFLEEASKLSPNESNIYFMLGTAHSNAKNYEKAIEFTQKSLSLSPNNRDIKQNLAIAYQQYAAANVKQRNLLLVAEKILLEIYEEDKKATSSVASQKEKKLYTLDLICKNYLLQHKKEKEEAYKKEIKAINNQTISK